MVNGRYLDEHLMVLRFDGWAITGFDLSHRRNRFDPPHRRP
jgi:hypothetical protein